MTEDGFYEDDEPVDRIVKIFEVGTKGEAGQAGGELGSSWPLGVAFATPSV